MILSGPPGSCRIGRSSSATEGCKLLASSHAKDVVHPHIALLDNGEVSVDREITTTAIGSFTVDDHGSVAVQPSEHIRELLSKQEESWVPLEKLCLARSGDKGDSVNIGVLARNKKIFTFLDQYLTAQRIKDYFQELCEGKVTRRLENMDGFNFLLDSSLGGGGTKTLRIDAQGKTFAQALLRQRVPAPKELLDEL